MSMNFNDNNNNKPTQTPKKNNTKTILIIAIVGFLGVFGAIGLIHEAQKTQSIVSSVTPEPDPQPQPSNLEQKLFTKCQNLQDYYNSIGVESDYKCEQYAKAYNGLIK